jgi:hypothetical protein
MSAKRRAIGPVVALAALALPAPAEAVVREIGVPPDQPLPVPTCPENCQAVVQATGYQVQLGNTRNPFRVNRAGRVVAFTIRLGKPDAEQRSFFENTFGGRAQARLAVLKPARTARRHRLLQQSEVFQLTPYFGSSPTFALDRPLTIEPGNVIALTTPTYAPAFAVGLGEDIAWRSSRPANDCNEFQIPSAQQTLRSLRTYQCFYRTARLLYSATFVPNPTPTEPQS